MIEPTRFRERPPSDLTKVLMDAGHAEAPPSVRLDRMLGGIASATVALGAHTASAAPGVFGAAHLTTQSAPLVGGIMKWLGLGVIAGAVVGATATRTEVAPADADVVVEGRPIARVRAARLERHSLEPTRSRRVKPNADDAREPRAGGADPPTSRALRTTGLDPHAAASVGTAEAVALRDEVAALALAKAALNRGAPAAALDAVRAYQARYPAGRLAPEATYIEMEAELALGNRASARAIASRLTSGSSPNAERARAIVKETER